MNSIGCPNTVSPVFIQKPTDSSSSIYSSAFLWGWSNIREDIPRHHMLSKVSKANPSSITRWIICWLQQKLVSFFTSSVSRAGPGRQGYLLSPKRKENNSSKWIHACHMKRSFLKCRKDLFRMNSWKTLLKMQRSLCQQKSTWAG